VKSTTSLNKDKRSSWSASPSLRNVATSKGRPSSAALRYKAASTILCDTTCLDDESVPWSEAPRYEKYAARALKKVEARTHFFNPQREATFPRFERREMTKGVLLGRGGFCAVHEIKELKPLSDQFIESEALDLPLSDKDRRLMSKMCIRDGDARYAVKKLVVDGRREPERYAKGLLDLAVEMKFLAVFDHPHIVKIRAVSNANVCSDGYFIVLDRLYDTLEMRLVSWKKDAMQARSIKKKLLGEIKVLDPYLTVRLIAAYDICSAVDHMHSHSIIYRDLKPENVGFDVRNDVKVFDLGLAKELHSQDALPDGTYRLTGMTGSLRYMAPEVGKKLPYNLSADVYSIGIMLWQIITMETPFRGFNAQMHRERVIANGHRPAIPLKWPPALSQLVQRCWASNLSSRPTTQRVGEELRNSICMLEGSEDTGEAFDASGRTNKSIARLLDASERSLVAIPNH